MQPLNSLTPSTNSPSYTKRDSTTSSFWTTNMLRNCWLRPLSSVTPQAPISWESVTNMGRWDALRIQLFPSIITCALFHRDCPPSNFVSEYRGSTKPSGRVLRSDRVVPRRITWRSPSIRHGSVSMGKASRRGRPCQGNVCCWLFLGGWNRHAAGYERVGICASF